MNAELESLKIKYADLKSEVVKLNSFKEENKELQILLEETFEKMSEMQDEIDLKEKELNDLRSNSENFIQSNLNSEQSQGFDKENGQVLDKNDEKGKIKNKKVFSAISNFSFQEHHGNPTEFINSKPEIHSAEFKKEDEQIQEKLTNTVVVANLMEDLQDTPTPNNVNNTCNNKNVSNNYTQNPLVVETKSKNNEMLSKKRNMSTSQKNYQLNSNNTQNNANQNLNNNKTANFSFGNILKNIKPHSLINK